MKRERPVCKVALINLDGSTIGILIDAFKQFRIQALDVTTRDYSGLGNERFDGCVLRLVPGCEAILEGIRNSRRDRHVFIYGITVPGKTIEHVSKFGINVLLEEPVVRQAALKIIRSTHLLVLHEFRRYVRVPLITDVTVKSGNTSYECSSVELSGGGMSLQSTAKLEFDHVVECSLKLPDNETLSCSATVCWIRPERELIGVRFTLTDKRRELIKKWIEQYLEM